MNLKIQPPSVTPVSQKKRRNNVIVWIINFHSNKFFFFSNLSNFSILIKSAGMNPNWLFNVGSCTIYFQVFFGRNFYLMTRTEFEFKLLFSNSIVDSIIHAIIYFFFQNKQSNFFWIQRFFWVNLHLFDDFLLH